MFDGMSILIVEDSALVALALADVVEAHGGHVVGPVSSVRHALELLETEPVAAAILDVRLADGEITPVAAHLAALGIPIVFHTGTGAPEVMAETWPDLLVIPKPAPIEAVARQLRIEISKTEQ